MKKLLLSAACLATLLGGVALVEVSTAQAQSSVTVGPNGVTVRERSDRVIVRERYDDRRRWRNRNRGCRDVTVRTRRGDGTVVVRRTRRCG